MKLEATMGIGREHTDSELRRNGGQSVGLDTFIDLPRDFTVGLNGDYRRTNYDGRGSVLPWLASEDHRDRTQTLSVSLYNRSFTIQGFSPKLVVTREARESNAQLQDYERTRGNSSSSGCYEAPPTDDPSCPAPIDTHRKTAELLRRLPRRRLCHRRPAASLCRSGVLQPHRPWFHTLFGPCLL